MSLRSDEQFLAAVAAALGESIALIRRRGFHLEVMPSDLDLRPVRRSGRQLENGPDDITCRSPTPTSKKRRQIRRRRCTQTAAQGRTQKRKQPYRPQSRTIRLF
jgi:hypothetical protein